MVIHGGVTARGRLEPIKKVVNNFCKRQFIGHNHAVGGQIVQIFLHAALFLAQLHDVAYVIVGHVDVHVHIRLIKGADLGGVWQMAGVVDLQGFAIVCVHLVDHRRRGGDEADLKFALQPFLNDLHVQQTKKAATEAKTQRLRRFRLKGKSRIVELQFFKGGFEVFVLV